MTQEVVDRAIQAHGGMGVSQDTFLVDAFASARALRLADGPDEVHYRTAARLELRAQENSVLGAIPYYNRDFSDI